MASRGKGEGERKEKEMGEEREKMTEGERWRGKVEGGRRNK